MENEFITLIVTYPNKKNINISMMLDDLNDKDIQDEKQNRDLVIEYRKKKGTKFNAKLYDYDGSIVFDTDRYNKDFFEKIFRVIDNLPAKPAIKDQILVTETLGTDIPTDEEMEETKEYVNEIEERQNQEVDDQPIGVEYPYAGGSYYKKYIQMKCKYISLKEKLLKKL